MLRRLLGYKRYIKTAAIDYYIITPLCLALMLRYDIDASLRRATTYAIDYQLCISH